MLKVKMSHHSCLLGSRLGTNEHIIYCRRNIEPEVCHVLTLNSSGANKEMIL